MNFLLKEEEINLDKLRKILIRLEDSISFALIERAQFKANNCIYEKVANVEYFQGLDFEGSFVKYLLYETEKTHAKVRRYTSPDEYPFSPLTALPQPILKPLSYSPYLKHNNINVNSELFKKYVNEIIPLICKEGDDFNYGSSATRDVECLQVISKRIHYGKFIAECKYREKTAEYNLLIKNKDSQGILQLLTNQKVEDLLLDRIRSKIIMYGQDPLTATSEEKINAEKVVSIFKDIIIPLTKEVEVNYLMSRLD